MSKGWATALTYVLIKTLPTAISDNGGVAIATFDRTLACKSR